MEELRLILEAIGGMAEHAKVAFIWYLVLDRLVPVMAWLTAVSVGAALVSSIVRNGIQERAAARGMEAEQKRETERLHNQRVLAERNIAAGMVQIATVVGYIHTGEVGAYGLPLFTAADVERIVEGVRQLKHPLPESQEG